MSGNGIPVVLGRCDDGRDLVIDLADSSHIALQGQTRSGKSVLLYVLLVNLARLRNVRVVGIDPTGILLNPWQTRPGAESRVLGTADMAQAATALESVVGDMDQRIADLLATDQDKMMDFTEGTPLVLVVLEEYPAALSAAEFEDADMVRKAGDRAATRIQRCVRRLIQEGAKVGIRVILVAQRMDAAIIGGAERSNLTCRISMRVDNMDALRMLHPNAGSELLAQVPYFTPGIGLVELPGQQIKVFKADNIDYSEYVARVKEGAK